MEAKMRTPHVPPSSREVLLSGSFPFLQAALDGPSLVATVWRRRLRLWDRAVDVFDLPPFVAATRPAISPYLAEGAERMAWLDFQLHLRPRQARRDVRLALWWDRRELGNWLRDPTRHRMVPSVYWVALGVLHHDLARADMIVGLLRYVARKAIHDIRVRCEVDLWEKLRRLGDLDEDVEAQLLVDLLALLQRDDIWPIYPIAYLMVSAENALRQHLREASAGKRGALEPVETDVADEGDVHAFDDAISAMDLEPLSREAEAMTDGAETRVMMTAFLRRLTSRERELVVLHACDYADAAIARWWGISPGRVAQLWVAIQTKARTFPGISAS
jgi:hypothetical protein